MNCFGKYAKAGIAVFALLKRHPKWAPYPKPFKQTRSVCLAFLILVSLHKRAYDAALNEKSLSFA
jgi:hypothetical protein